MKGRITSIMNGQNTNFWHDPWCVLVSLKDKFPDLYEICREQNKSVAYLAERDWCLNFRRWLDESAQNHLRQLRDLITPCALAARKDESKWLWAKSGKFTVKSVYSSLFFYETRDSNHKLWKANLPLKLKSSCGESNMEQS